MIPDNPSVEPFRKSWVAFFTNARLWLTLVVFVVVLGGSWIAGSSLSRRHTRSAR